METIESLLNSHFHHAIVTAYPELKETPFKTEVVQSSNEKFGHYQCNAAMKLAKELKSNPRKVAEAILEKLEKDAIIEKVSIEGPGFINITLLPSFLAKLVKKILSDTHLGIEKKTKPLKIIIDFSSPNTAKEMHVGHLRSTIIGDCLARVFEFLGDDVLRLNHIGDWGTSFGMLIAHLKQNHAEVLKENSSTDLEHLVIWYKEAKKRFDEEPIFKNEAQKEVVLLQKGDREALKAWKLICSISSKAYQTIYDLLDVKLTERGESFYNPMLADIVKDLEEKNLITISDGAKCLFVEGFQNRDGTELPLMVQKSDGGYNYDTTDMAAIYHRVVVEKADRIIYVVDQGQSTHFQMIFKAAEMAGYLDPSKVSVDHVGFGLVLGLDGKKFRTRSGETEKLIDLLNRAIETAKVILHERIPDLKEPLLTEEAKDLGLGAVKYADLSSHRISDYTFSYEKMLKFEGNTAAFIMYSYVRVNGIKRKVGVEIAPLIANSKIELSHPSEIALGLYLAQFPETLNQVTKDLLPNRLTDYLYGLAEKFNAFFRDCQVAGSDQQNSRLLICEATGRTLKTGLKLLGINTLDRM